MNRSIFFALLILAGVTALRHPRPKPHPKPHGPLILVKPLHKSAVGKDLEFKFAVLGLKPLDGKLIAIKKFDGKNLVDSDIEFKVKELSAEEIKEFIANRKKEAEEAEEEKEEKEGRPRPILKHTHIIVGKALAANVSCKDMGPYKVVYGKAPAHPHPKPHPRPRPGAFFVAVEGCKPKPEAVVFVRPIQKAELGKELEFKFVVLGMNPLNLTSVFLKKIDNKTVSDAAFDVTLKQVTADDIKEFIEEHKKDDGDRRPHPHPHPRPHPPKPKYVILGTVKSAGVTCEDGGKYVVGYGKRPSPKDAELDHHPKPHPRPHHRPILRPIRFFGVFVKGCKRY